MTLEQDLPLCSTSTGWVFL